MTITDLEIAKSGGNAITIASGKLVLQQNLIGGTAAAPRAV